MSRQNARSWSVVFVVLVLLLTAAACGGSNPLVGKWSDSSGIGVVDFKGNGDVVLTIGSTSRTGTYSIKDSVLTIEMGAPITLTYSVAGDKLTTTTNSGHVTEYTRVK